MFWYRGGGDTIQQKRHSPALELRIPTERRCKATGRSAGLHVRQQCVNQDSLLKCQQSAMRMHLCFTRHDFGLPTAPGILEKRFSVTI